MESNQTKRLGHLPTLHFALSGLQTAGAGILLLAICFIIYSSTLTGYFLADDFGYVQLYYGKSFSELSKILAADWSQGIWGYPLHELRPVIALSYLGDAFVWKVNSLGFHITNVFVHSLNSILVLLIARWLVGANLTSAFVAASLFALHPAHAEPVSWIAGRTDLISSFFYLSGVLAFGLYRSTDRRRYCLLSVGLYILGLFSKEMVISFPLMIFAYDLFHHRALLKGISAKWWLPHAVNVGVLAGYLWLREVAFGSALGAGEMALGRTLPEFAGRQGYYLSHLFQPADWLVERYSGQWVLISLAGLLLALCLGLLNQNFRRRVSAALAGVGMPALYFGIAWYLISISPLFRTYIAQRHLYLPSVGICIVLGLLLPRLLPKPVFITAFILLSIYYGHLLHQANKPWRRAGQLSGRMHQEINALLQNVPAGSGLMLKLPVNNGSAYVWAWASPFAFRQPFSPADLHLRYQVLETPDVYCCSWAKDKIPLVRALIEAPVDSFLFYLDSYGHVREKKISKEQLAQQLQDLLAGANLSDQVALSAKWDALWQAQASAP